MLIVSTTKTEHRALNALETIIDDHDTMEHQFQGDDKEMAWDGFILLFKDNNGDSSLKNLESRVPVQIKGHNDPNNKYINRSKTDYSVRLSDLRAYATEKGVLYFQIFINGKQREIFYSSLYPSRILDYLELAKQRNNKVTISIPFRKLEKDPSKLYIIAKQFSQEAVKQGSAYTPIVQNRIRIDDLPNVKEIKMSVIGAKNPYDAFMRLSSGDVCLYGKTKDDKFERPIEWQENSVFSYRQLVKQRVSVGGQVFYDQYYCTADTNGGMVIELSQNLKLIMPQNTFKMDFRTSITQLYYDCKFLLQVLESSSLYIQEMEIKYAKFSIEKSFETKLHFWVDYYETLQMIKLDIDIPVSEYTETQRHQIFDLVNLRFGSHNSQLINTINKYNWQFGDKYYPLFVMKNEDHTLSLSSSVYSDTIGIFCPYKEKGIEKGYTMPLFCFEDETVLSNLYYYNYYIFQKQIKQSEINQDTAATFLEASLTIINVFDINHDSHFLELAEEMLERVIGFNLDDMILLNQLQIKKRKGIFDDSDMEKLNSLVSTDYHILFGKYVLQGLKDKADEQFNLFSEEEKEQYKKYPIFKYCVQMQ